MPHKPGNFPKPLAIFPKKLIIIYGDTAGVRKNDVSGSFLLRGHIGKAHSRGDGFSDVFRQTPQKRKRRNFP
jgi:hypothetical protein